MKKLVGMILTAGLVLSLTLFPQQVEAQGGAESYTIPTVVKLIGVAWFNRMEEGVKQFGEETGHETFQQGPPQADAAQQVQIVQDLLAQRPDAITVVPFSPESLEPVLARAREQGIVVISHEASNMQNVDYDVEAFVNEDYGRQIMDSLAECMGEEGQYAAFVGSLTSETHNQWVDAAIAHQQENYPNMELVGSKNESNDDQQVAYTKAQELLRTYPDLKGFQGSASTDVAGIGLAVEQRGMEDRTCVFGTSVPSVSGQYLETGAIDGIFFWDPAKAGYAMNEVAVRLLDGGKIQTGDDLGVEGYENVRVEGKVIYGDAAVAVDASNMDDYDF
jgi:simple sugar transport system substrate-binding protein